MGGSGGRLVKFDAQVVSCGTEMPTTDRQVGCSLGESVFCFFKGFCLEIGPTGGFRRQITTGTPLSR